MLTFFSFKNEHYRDIISSIFHDDLWDNQWFLEQCVSFVTSLSSLGIRPYVAQTMFDTEFHRYAQFRMIAETANGVVLAELIEYGRTNISVRAQVFPEIKPDTLIYEDLIAMPVENPYRVSRYDDIPVKYETGRRRAFSPLVPVHFPLCDSNKYEIDMVARYLGDYADLMKSYRDASSVHVYPGIGPISNAFVAGYTALPNQGLIRHSKNMLVNPKDVTLVKVPGSFQVVPDRDGIFCHLVITHYPSITSFVSPREEGLVAVSPYFVVSLSDSFDVRAPGRYETLKELVDAISK